MDKTTLEYYTDKYSFEWNGSSELKVSVYEHENWADPPIAQFDLVPWFDSLHIKSAMIEFKFACEKWVENEAISATITK